MHFHHFQRASLLCWVLLGSTSRKRVRWLWRRSKLSRTGNDYVDGREGGIPGVRFIPLQCTSALTSKVPPLPESPELTAVGSLGFLLLIINKRAVLPVLFALAQGSSQPVCPALPERHWHDTVASDPVDDLLPLPPSPLAQSFNCCSTRGLTSGTAEPWKIT